MAEWFSERNFAKNCPFWFVINFRDMASEAAGENAITEPDVIRPGPLRRSP